MGNFALLLVVFIASWLLTGAVRRYALAQQLIDVPNARSSHQVPTPRGGGVAIVAVYLSAVALYFFQDGLDPGTLWVLLVSGALIAALGLWDDHGHVPARWRLIGHFLAATWVVVGISSDTPLDLYFFSVTPGLLLSAGFIVYLVWMLNLFNFMDGIDGIASSQAIFCCLSAALLYAVTGYSDLAGLPLMLAAATAGFLVWNLPPARIFMGDAGSGFLGIMMGVLSLQAASIHPDFLWCWLILMGAFIVDATFTLVRRILGGSKFYEAHRTHAYQHASRVYASHSAVVGRLFLLNLFWLLPIAALVAFGQCEGIVALMVAYVPLVFIGIKFRAGLPQP